MAENSLSFIEKNEISKAWKTRFESQTTSSNCSSGVYINREVLQIEKESIQNKIKRN